MTIRTPKRLHEKSHFLFDLDGTLVDSSPVHAAAFESTLQANTPELAADFRYETIRGMSTPDSFRALGVSGGSLVARLTEEKRRRYREAVEAGQLALIPGARRLLELLTSHGRHLCVVTSASGGSSSAALRTTRIEHFFSAVVTSEDVERSKPHPDIILHCLDRFGLEKAAVVVIEDADSGILSALGAGVDVVAVFEPTAAGLSTWRFPALTNLFYHLRTTLGEVG